MKAILYFDGSSHPRSKKPASWGYVLEIEGREPIEGQGMCKDIYPQTNNTAEYSGLCHGLRRASIEGVTDLQVYGDSELIIYQVTGKYRVNKDGKTPHLQTLHAAALSLIQKFPKFQIGYMKDVKADSVSRVTKPSDGTIQRSTKANGKITIH